MSRTGLLCVIGPAVLLPALALLEPLAGSARAEIGPPVDVELLGDPHPAEAGLPYTGTFRITALAEVTVAAFEFPVSEGWSPVFLADPGPTFLGTGQSVDVPFETVAVDPNGGPLTLDFRVDDLQFTYDFNLSPELFAEGDIAQPTRIVVPDGGKAPAKAASLARPDPAPPAAGTPLAPWYGKAQPPAGADAPADLDHPDDPDKSSRWITVHGRFIYTRPDNVTDGADGFTVQVFADGQVVGTTTTDPFGYYSLPVYYVEPSAGHEPDLRVEFVADNVNVVVRNSANKTMRWTSGTWSDFAGNDLDTNWLHPSSLDHQVFVHGFTVLNRAWRWILADAGVDWVKVAMRREAKGGPWYEAGKKLIHCTTDRMWMEITVVHEVGHHFLEWHAAGVGGPSNYCNGVCEDKKCGHCTWCYEEAEDAWNEGFPTWLGMMLIDTLPSQYGVIANNLPNFENLAFCTDHGPPTLDDPLRNEGPFVALLCDIVDAANEDDTLVPETSGWFDRLTLGTGPIWDVVWQDAPLTPQEFLTGFLGNNGSLREDVWETAKNNGYEIDTQDPPAPFFFSSTSHTPNTPSSDGTIDLYWLTALDDASGIAGYSLAANLNAPLAPDFQLSCGDVNTFTTIQLPAGNWWFTIRSLDRAGRWSPGYATYGPVVLSAPATADLTTASLMGWAQPFVPQPLPDVDPADVPLPAQLIGGADTWWNLAMANDGSGDTVGDIRLAVRIDGREADSAVLPGSTPLPPRSSASIVNSGPVTVGGGRHAFGIWMDAQETQAEMGELDNHWAWQWLWRPAELAVGPPLAQPSPPLLTGGWENLAGGAAGPNADAVRLRTSPGACEGFFLFTADTGVDYDLQLHAASDDPQAGLDTYVATSARVAGFLDAVLIRSTAPQDVLYDAAIVNYSGGGSPAVIGKVSAEPHLLFDQTVLDFGQDQMLKLGTVTVDPGLEGPLSLRLETDPALGPLHVLWYGNDLTLGNLLSWSGYGRTGADGTARLDVMADTPGDYFFAFYRDPSGGTQPQSATFDLAPTLPDAVPVQPAGWYAAVVPHPLPDGTPGDVPAPDTLYAEPAATYLNFAVLNDSPVAWPPNPCAFVLDGVPAGTFALPALAAGETGVFNGTDPLMVPGGRHTAGIQADPDLLVPEMNETNNAWAVQWSWQPQVLLPGLQAVSVHPPDPGGGWEAIADPGPAGLAYNCAGRRIEPAPDPDTRAGQWTAVAVMPAAGEDADVQLHEASPGAQDGFGSALALSGWSADECDFVLVNFNRTAVRPFDAGVLRSLGTNPAEVTAVLSAFLGNDPTGQTAIFTLPAVQMLALHEVWLSPGVWVVHLENLDGAIDYGLTAHPGELAYLGKSNALAGGSSWLAAAGQDEWTTFTVDVGRYYCLSVWKRSATDLPLEGSYRLALQAGMSPTPPASPAARTALTGAQPNPFNPRVTVNFSLQAAGPVDLSVYDLKGRRVRRLVSGALLAGEHQAVWDGQDTRGSRCPSGAYVLRLVGPGGVTDQRRVTMVK